MQMIDLGKVRYLRQSFLDRVGRVSRRFCRIRIVKWRIVLALP